MTPHMYLYGIYRIQGFLYSSKGWGYIGNFSGGMFLTAEGNLRRSDFDNLNRFRSWPVCPKSNYKIKTKIVQEQWLQLKETFLLGYYFWWGGFFLVGEMSKFLAGGGGTLENIQCCIQSYFEASVLVWDPKLRLQTLKIVKIN